MRAGDFFRAVRDAAEDAERCARQLKALELRLHSSGGGTYEPRARAGAERDRIGRRVAAFLDQEAVIEARQDEDYRLIDRACAVLYGGDQTGGGGLCKAPPSKAALWADALWWRYCAAESWDGCARAMGNSPADCRKACAHALTWLDKTGYAASLMDVEAIDRSPVRA